MKTYVEALRDILRQQQVKTSLSGDELACSYHDTNVSISLAAHASVIATAPQKLAAMISSKLKMNARIFARNCSVKKIEKAVAEEFLKAYHLMNATQSAFNYGLFYKDDLVAVAAFSKGRKMNRLAEDKRSYELIRFCCKAGISVAGGLTKLVSHFCREKNAGDVMTYVDKQLSDGRSFITAGFKKHSDTAPNYFLVNKSTFEKIPVKDKDAAFDETTFYPGTTSGNIKLIYTPDENT